MNRSKFARALSINLMISHNIHEIRWAKNIIQYHELNQKVLRERLNSCCKNGYEKQKIEHKIHNNKIIIHGMAQYIVELRSEMKTLQRKYSLNQEKKNDTEKA